MSKYKVYDIQFTHQPAFCAALRDVCDRMGKAFEEATDNNLPLIGWRGDRRPERARWVIRQRYLNHASNDLGFAVRPDGAIHPLISEYDSRPNMVATQIVKGVQARYAYHQTRELAYQHGYTVTERAQPDGTIELELQRTY